MKTWEDFKKDWEHLARESPGKWIAPKEAYVIMHCLESINTPDPREEDRAKIEAALSTMTKEEAEDFLQYFQKVKNLKIEMPEDVPEEDEV